jgi:hypothetical protein
MSPDEQRPSGRSVYCPTGACRRESYDPRNTRNDSNKDLFFVSVRVISWIVPHLGSEKRSNNEISPD